MWETGIYHRGIISPYYGSSTRLFTVKYTKMVVNRTNALFVLKKMKNCLHSWLSARPCFIRTIANQNAYSPGGGGGGAPPQGGGGKTPSYLAVKVSFRVAREKIQ